MRDQGNGSQLIMFLGLGLGLVALGISGVSATVQSQSSQIANGALNGVTQLFRSVDSYTTLFGSLQEVRDENLRYKGKVAELETELNQKDELAEENKWLRSQLLLELPRPQEGSLSKVLKYEYSPSIGYVYVSAAADVRVGDLATVYDYVVGEIVEVKADTARVRLLAANDTNMLVKIGAASAIGKLKGTGGLALEVNEVQANSQVEVGDTLKLLNPVGPYAVNYELGKVAKINGTPADPLWSLEVDFPVDLFKLEYLIVIPNHE